MKSTLNCLNSNILIADLNNKKHLEDIILVLNNYKKDGMGQSPQYTKQEVDNLLQLFIDHPKVIVFLVYVENKIAGGSVCFEAFSTFSAKKIINIHDICILNNFRSLGLGRKLMKKIITYGKSLECSKVTLEVREDNIIARKLYKNLGFIESSPIMNFWHKPL